MMSELGVLFRVGVTIIVLMVAVILVPTCVIWMIKSIYNCIPSVKKRRLQAELVRWEELRQSLGDMHCEYKAAVGHVYESMGKIYISLGQTADALKSYEAARYFYLASAGRSPMLVDYFNAYADLLQKCGYHDEAASISQEAKDCELDQIIKSLAVKRQRTAVS